jgi:hypothetical protein
MDGHAGFLRPEMVHWRLIPTMWFHQETCREPTLWKSLSWRVGKSHVAIWTMPKLPQQINHGKRNLLKITTTKINNPWLYTLYHSVLGINWHHISQFFLNQDPGHPWPSRRMSTPLFLDSTARCGRWMWPTTSHVEWVDWSPKIPLSFIVGEYTSVYVYIYVCVCIYIYVQIVFLSFKCLFWDTPRPKGPFPCVPQVLQDGFLKAFRGGSRCENPFVSCE